MPRVSINWGSNRPGGIDVVLAGLARQTYKDFEVVFVDGRYHERHGLVLDAVERAGLEQPFYHVPNHRYRPSGPWGTTCAGYNTGFALSSGEVVVMLLDYGYAPPRWLEEHVKHQDAGRKIVLGPHEYRTLRPELLKVEGEGELTTFDRARVEARGTEATLGDIAAQRRRFGEISCFAQPFEPKDLELFPVEESDAKCKISTQEWQDDNYFNTKNESFPLESVLDANGMDENYDLGRGPGDPDLCYRMRRLQPRLPLWIVNEAIVHCLNPRGLLPNVNIVVPEDGRLDPPYGWRWSALEGLRYFVASKLRGTPRAPNPFEIRELRDRIWEWREMSKNPRAIIPRVEVEDAAYYSGGRK